MRPSVAVQDYGLKCYREPGTPFDGRPVLFIRQCWTSEEETAYVLAVRHHPRGTIEGFGSYIQRIAGIVAQGPLGPAVRPMPSRCSGPARPSPTPPELAFEDRMAVLYGPREPGVEG